jgi:uncharacterized protein YndB with AHSA1/START domain
MVMSNVASIDTYGVQTAPATVRIQRLLPGTVERVWAYLTQGDLRRQWLAAGDMDLKAGGAMTLTWRNDELSGDLTGRPEGATSEHSLHSHIIRVDPPRLLAFDWNGAQVTFELERAGDDVLLTVTHERLPDRDTLLSVSAGWHAHLDLLADRVAGREARPFWSAWSRLRGEYAVRLS